MEMTQKARSLFGVTFIALAAFLAAGLMSASPGDWPFDPSAGIARVGNVTGPFGSLLAWTTGRVVGSAFAWLLPLVFLTLALNSFRGGKTTLRRWVWKGAGAAVLLGAVFSQVPATADVAALHGVAGEALARGLSVVFGNIGTAIVLVAGLLLLAVGELGRVGVSVLSGVRSASRSVAGFVPSLFGRMRDGTREYFSALFHNDEDEADFDVENEPLNAQPEAPPRAAQTADEWEGPIDAVSAPVAPVQIARPDATPVAPRAARTRSKSSRKNGTPIEKATLPDRSILDNTTHASATYSADELKQWSTVLEEKLINYGVEGKVTAVHHGPVVTTFEFEPLPGVRIKEIVARSDDLALAMRARSLRMIAPIPGRAAVGIEIPNPRSAVVYFRRVLDAIDERSRLSGVMIAVGVDVVGKPFVMNLCTAPHLMIAGTTGSGKSVCLNTLIASILFQYRPSDVKLLLVDPKVVEMTMYEGIPHLLHPVITDPKEAGKVLEYLVAEMQRRNHLFRRHGVKNIESFNMKVEMGRIEAEEPVEKLPYIVLIVDELGDLMAQKGIDIEGLLTRLAQMARAAGIHMVLATQRPSVDVIRGRLKANLPMRIAFRVATRVDSRTIIDEIGAEKLLGRGDMLFVDSLNPVPVRLHGAWVSEGELEHLVGHWNDYEFEQSSLDLTAGRGGAAGVTDDLDPLFEDARAVVIQSKQGSTSLLQRRLSIGYARAARVLDQLEQQGIVGPPDGSKPREVYVDNIPLD